MALPDPSESATALVTGASSGIGAAIARELASRGHGVTLVARREERLRELAASLEADHAVRAEVVAADLEAEESRDRLAARIEELDLAVEILVNNAGFGGAGKLARSDRLRLLAMLRVNCEAPLDLQARYVPGMIERGVGAVINIASTAAFQPIPGTATYAASKAFLLSLSDALHAELKGTGVTVTAICPGPVKTEFTRAAGLDKAEQRTPGFIWTSAEELARSAVEAAEKGKRAIVPGLLNRAGAFSGQHAPRGLALPIAKRVWSQAQ